jgi:hypothetical protein
MALSPHTASNTSDPAKKKKCTARIRNIAEALKFEGFLRKPHVTDNVAKNATH